MNDQNPWPWIAAYTPPRVLRDFPNRRVREALAVAHSIMDERADGTDLLSPLRTDAVILRSLRDTIPQDRPVATTPKLTETPLFRSMARELDTGHEVLRILRAERVKRNGPTPPSTPMERVQIRERFGLMASVDEHHPDL